MRDQRGPKNPVWKGDAAGYMAIHQWMDRNHPKTGRCEHCVRTERPTEYASIGHIYTRNRADWLELCVPCHRTFDGRDTPWNKGKSPNAETRAKMSAAARARAERARPTHCPHGHPYDEANTYINPNSGKRLCRACNREHARRRAQGLVPSPGM